MNIQSTTDMDKIKTVLCDEWIYNRISEDGTPPPEEYEPPTQALYLIDDDLSGVMIFHPLNAITFEMHIQMLNKEVAMEFCQSCIKWFWDKSYAKKIIAQIPEIYPDVCRFAEKNGFEREGINRASYLKDGKIHSQVYYGLLKPGA